MTLRAPHWQVADASLTWLQCVAGCCVAEVRWYMRQATLPPLVMVEL